MWTVRAVTKTPATGVRVRVGSINVESAVEVLGSEADRYQGVKSFGFGKKTYKIRTDSNQKKIRLLAPLSLVPKAKITSASFTSFDAT